MFKILRQVSFFVLALLAATVLVFMITYLVPGDVSAYMLGDTATPAEVAALRDQLGLNDPVWMQYWRYLSGLLRGDLGMSIVTKESVAAIVARTLPRTLQLVVGALIIGVVAGIPLGVFSATRKDGAVDRFTRLYATAALSMPTFWVGIVLISVFAIEFRLLPSAGQVSFLEDPLRSIRYSILPSLALGFHTSAIIARQTRSSMLGALGADFVRTQVAMGYSRASIVWRHALKNAAIPIVTVLGITINTAVGFTIIIEAVFAIPGLGSAMITAALARDLPVVQGGLIVIVAVVMLVNLLLDLVYLKIDPRMEALQ
jgi:peptide/nickel transport system permease protein